MSGQKKRGATRPAGRAGRSGLTKKQRAELDAARRRGRAPGAVGVRRGGDGGSLPKPPKRAANGRDLQMAAGLRGGSAAQRAALAAFRAVTVPTLDPDDVAHRRFDERLLLIPARMLEPADRARCRPRRYPVHELGVRVVVAIGGERVVVAGLSYEACYEAVARAAARLDAAGIETGWRAGPLPGALAEKMGRDRFRALVQQETRHRGETPEEAAAERAASDWLAGDRPAVNRAAGIPPEVGPR